MHAPPKLIFDQAQFRPHSTRDRMPGEQKLTRLRPRTDVLESQEVEGLRLPASSFSSTHRRERAEHNQARLVWMQLEPKLAQSLAQFALESYGYRVVLEADDHVVRISDDEELLARLLGTPAVDPQVVDVVQIDIRQQTRNRRALRRTLVTVRPHPIFEDPGSEPFLDQAEDPLVRDAVLDEFDHPTV